MQQQPQGENTFRSMLGVLAGIAGAVALAAGLNTALSAGKAPRDLVDQEFSDSAAGAVIRQRFGEDYRAALAAIPPDHALSPSERVDHSATIAQTILSKYSRFAGRADDAVLREVIAARAALLRYVQEKKNPMSCSRLLKEGPDFLRPTPGHIAEKMDQVFAAVMTAIAEGRDHPVNRKAVYPQDWEAFDAAVRAAGLSQQQLDWLDDAGVHEEDCGSAIVYFETLASFPGEAGERVRSYTVDAIASLS